VNLQDLEISMASIVVSEERRPLVLQTKPLFEMNSALFFDFCQANHEWRIERNAEGEILLMPPTGGTTSNQNALLNAALTLWSLRDGTGVAFDSSGGFDLPNGATRSPDAAWIKKSRLATLTPEQKKHFLPLCPDFVSELRSSSDRLKTLQEKMQEYLDNGVQLGWLLDTPNRRVYVYRPGQGVLCLENPTTLSGDPVLPGFVLDLVSIWEPNF
jgi:Uma2 family endonuclease